MDYLSYFKLRTEPFSHAPLSQFYFASRQHSEALSRLTYAVSSMKGLAVLVGDVGRGKSTLARRLLDSLPDEQYEASMLVVLHAAAGPKWLLRRLAAQLGVESPAEEPLAAISQIYRRLVNIHESGKRAVVLIDEAQMLNTRETMEELRGLLNLEIPGHKLITFVFFGLPELEDSLRLDAPLAQRVAMRFQLSSLGPLETSAYVRHRMEAAGSEDDVFPADALQKVHRYTRGVPRLINTLCDNVLLEMFFARQSVATAAQVTQVALNLGMSDTPAPESLPAKAASIAPVALQSPMAPPPTPPGRFSGAVAMPRNLSEEADEIAAGVAGESRGDLFSGEISVAEAAVELPGNSWPGVESVGEFLGNIPLSVPMPPAPKPPAAKPRLASPASRDLLADVDNLLAELNKPT